ncbi:MAG: DNA mismatch repair protein MutS, partial [Bacteriovoracaceae bacterium]|nr:DNA mismatch repair protein MutS [Bacteriovoracaceae bacterium]
HYLILIDYTTGDFVGLVFPDEESLVEKLAIYRPKEFISFLGQWDNSPVMQEFLKDENLLKTHLSEEYFEEKYTSIYIEKLIATYQRDEVLNLHKEIVAPIGALSYYICSTQSLDSINHFRPFQLISFEADMKVTYPTLAGLEILPKRKENYKESILGFMDSTQSAMGARKLKRVFLSPLRDLKLIQARQKLVEFLIENNSLLKEIRIHLGETRDLERIMAKVSTGKVNGGDLINLARSNQSHTDLLELFKGNFKSVLPEFDKTELEQLVALQANIQNTINDEIGANLDKGNLIKEGCSQERDKLAGFAKNATGALMQLEARYRTETGIPNLKVKHNNVAGYFIEISKSHVNKVPKEFVRRQTLVNSERYQSPELAEFEKDVVSSKEKLHKLEREIFNTLVSTIAETSGLILKLANSLALMDVFQSFAWAAFQHEFVKPQISKDQKVLKIKKAWHPLIKAAIKDQFVPHDLTLDEDNFFGLITGPNMAGKTTVMREMAIIQFLAQVGSFVPAQSAHLGMRDYLFSRLGASDDIIKGQSTFMVEMSETAEILRHATEDSLIVLDEIGRGTSTYDGLSIAWSLVEYFVSKTKALTLFSTHYHELIELADDLPGAKNLTVKTVNENGNVQFLYKLIEEGAGQSFGIHVAKLAGLPKEILNRSGEILSQLENSSGQNTILGDEKAKNQLDMFTPMPQIVFEDMSSSILDELENLDLANMTPIQAMNKLYELQKSYQS